MKNNKVKEPQNSLKVFILSLFASVLLFGLRLDWATPADCPPPAVLTPYHHLNCSGGHYMCLATALLLARRMYYTQNMYTVVSLFIVSIQASMNMEGWVE